MIEPPSFLPVGWPLTRSPLGRQPVS